MRDINVLPTWLYYLQRGDVDLYVGVTCHLPSRIEEHRQKRWWAEVEHIQAYRFPEREQALAWEALHIRGVLPVYNREVPPSPVLQPDWCWFCGWSEAIDGGPQDDFIIGSRGVLQDVARVLCPRCAAVV